MSVQAQAAQAAVKEEYYEVRAREPHTHTLQALSRRNGLHGRAAAQAPACMAGPCGAVHWCVCVAAGCLVGCCRLGTWRADLCLARANPQVFLDKPLGVKFARGNDGGAYVTRRCPFLAAVLLMWSAAPCCCTACCFPQLLRCVLGMSCALSGLTYASTPATTSWAARGRCLPNLHCN